MQRRTADGLARFIPAGAGNSGTGPALTGGGSVYPRWRGELRSGEQHNNSVPGLSPLARGTRCAHRRQLFPVRFIPAGAGNSNTTANKHDVIRVYPRWRGELKTTGPDHLKGAGLSPLARGTQPDADRYRASPRFIPAGAGNSLGRWRCSAPDAVYPRWRGELNS